MDPSAKLARLDAASGFRLTIILDPDGETKDAALESWGYHQACPLAWMRLDHTDNDPLRFFPRLKASLHSTGLFSTALPLRDQNPVWEDYLSEALNEAIDVSGDFFLILDDYHLIHSPEIHQVLSWMLDYIPDRMHLLITSHQPLPLPLPRLRLRHQLLEIDLR